MALHHSVIRYREELDALSKDNLKRCTKCKEIKSISAFTKNSRLYGGYSNHCSVCMSVSLRNRIDKFDKKSYKLIEKEHLFRQEQRELEKDGNRRCAACLVVKNLESNFKHRNDKWARFKDDCKECAEHKSLLSRSKKSQQSANTRVRNQVRIWASRVLHSHFKRGYTIEATASDIISLVNDDGSATCYYTGDKIFIRYGASVDMKDPKGRFSIDNLCICSNSCNSTKQGMSESAFVRYLEMNPSIVARIKRSNENWHKIRLVENIPLAILEKLANDQYIRHQ